MVWINILLYEGDHIDSLNALDVPIQRNLFKEIGILNERLSNIGYSLIFVKRKSYLIELTHEISKDSYRKAVLK